MQPLSAGGPTAEEVHRYLTAELQRNQARRLTDQFIVCIELGFSANILRRAGSSSPGWDSRLQHTMHDMMSSLMHFASKKYSMFI